MTSTFLIRPARPEDADAIATTLRRFGAEEARGLDLSADAIRAALSISAAAWVWEVDGDVGCLFGLEAPVLIGDRAGAWWLTTPLVSRDAFRFLRAARRVVAAMRQRYPMIEGHIRISDEVSIRWLRWLGFTVYRDAPVSIAGVFAPGGSIYYPFNLRI